MSTDVQVPLEGGTVTIPVPDPIKGDKGDTGNTGAQGDPAPPASNLGHKVGVAGATVTLDWQSKADGLATLTMPPSGVVGLAHTAVVLGASVLVTVKSTGNATLNHVDTPAPPGGNVRAARSAGTTKVQPSPGTATMPVYDVLSFVTVLMPDNTLRIVVSKFIADMA